MMRCLVSGEAAKVAVVNDLDVTYFHAAQPEVLIPSSFSELHHIFQDASDVEEIAVERISETYPVLLSKYNFDRGLMLLDIAISDDDDDLRLEAAICFEKIIEDKAAFSRIKDYVFSSDNPLLPSEEWILSIKDRAPLFTQFLEQLYEVQPHILRLQSALDLSLSYSELTETEKEEFRFHAVDTGSFARLVVSGNDLVKINAAIMECFQKLKFLKSARTIVTQWTKGMIVKRTKSELRKVDREIKSYENYYFSPSNNTEKSSYENYNSAKRQIHAIVEKLRNDEISSARRYSSDLVRSQIKNGGEIYAAKSLSNLAIEARKMGHVSLELEWARNSVQIAPEDGVAQGVLADTYLRLSRIPEAIDAFKNASALGEDEFGEVGLVRVYRYCGRYDDALSTIRSVIDKYSVSSVSVETLATHAAILNDMWREEESLEAYRNALDVHPADPVLSCGMASVLSDLGRLDEAISIYRSVMSRFNESPTAWCGLAEIYKLKGDWDVSLSIYREAIDKFPTSVIANCGYADVLRASGEFERALGYYRETEKRFPFSPVPLSGSADTLKDMKEYRKALDILTESCVKYPLDQRLRNGLANAFKLCGNFEESLRQFDRNVKDFPYNLYDLGGRANLLKLLGRYEKAIDAYDEILRKRPDYRFANNAKAAILAAQQKYDEALEILQVLDPSTEVQWSTMQVRAVTLLRRGDLEEAELLLKNGLNSPFIRTRFMFERSLALLNMKRSRLQEAYGNLEGHNDFTSQLFSIHILLKLGDKYSATEKFNAVNDNLPGALADVRTELSRVISSTSIFDEDADNRIFQKEVEALLQAA